MMMTLRTLSGIGLDLDSAPRRKMQPDPSARRTREIMACYSKARTNRMYRPDSNKCLSFVERLESGHGKVDPGVWNAPSAVRRSRRSRRGCGKAEEWARGARDAAYYRRLERGDRAAVANERGGIFRSLSRDLRKLVGSGTASQTLNGFPAHNRKKLNTGGERHRTAIIPRAYGVEASRVQR